MATEHDHVADREQMGEVTHHDIGMKTGGPRAEFPDELGQVDLQTPPSHSGAVEPATQVSHLHHTK